MNIFLNRDGTIDWRMVGSMIVLLVILASCVSMPVMIYHYERACESAGGSYRVLRSDPQGLCIAPDGRIIPNP